jgi:hypothetical protein
VSDEKEGRRDVSATPPISNSSSGEEDTRRAAETPGIVVDLADARARRGRTWWEPPKAEPKPKPAPTPMPPPRADVKVSLDPVDDWAQQFHLRQLRREEAAANKRAARFARRRYRRRGRL